VKEALMFEFTDAELKENIDLYVEALEDISQRAHTDPSDVKAQPKNTSVGRLDEVRASHPRTMRLSYRMHSH
jgi:glycine dehydrogenase subunit 2